MAAGREAGEPVRLQPLVRARVAALGDEGRAWAEELPGLLGRLAARWSLQLGRALPGGSASYLCLVVRADGSDAVLKVALPDQGTADHAQTLRAAEGRGCVRLLEAEPASGALLLERLGPSLAGSGLAVQEQVALLGATLAQAWRPPDRPAADKAASLAHGVRTWHAQHRGAATDRVVAQALAYADVLVGCRAEDLALVHGDPHPGNLLRVRHPRPGAETGWVLVDPDPFVGDRAYDLGVAVRDFSAALLADPGIAAERLRFWCRLAAGASGVDPARVWAWSFLERVSTGLYVTSFGAPRVAEPFLRSAALLVDADPPNS